MLSAVVAACAVLVACGVILVALRHARTQSDRRLDAILRRLDEQLESISSSVAQAIEAATAAHAHRAQTTLTLDFDELVDSLATTAASLTGADVAVLRVEGPGGRPVVASFGTGAETESLDRAFGPPDDTEYAAATIDWTYSAAGEPGDERFQSALVIPLGAVTEGPGTLAVYSTAAEAFRPDHTASLHALLADAAASLSNARRFAEVEARVNLDPATGVASRRGYELQLGREVARAHRTGRPLSVVIVGVGGVDNTRAPSAGIENGVGELARLLTRMTRRSDIACRRGDHELAVLLPETETSGATVFTTRLQAEVARAHPKARSTITVGLVEWLPDETPQALDARVESTLAPRTNTIVPAVDDARTASTATSSTVRRTLGRGADLVVSEPSELLRGDALEVLAHELVEARRSGRSLALVALDLAGLDEINARLGHEAADSTLSRVAESLGDGSVLRLGSSEFALALPGATVADAETLIDTLQSSLEPAAGREGVVLSAGITELTDGDDATAALDRVEHSLWQAKQAGPGTVVVAIPRRRGDPHG